MLIGVRMSTDVDVEPVDLPQVEIMQEDHKLFAVMGWNKRYAAVRIPRQFLQMDQEEQRWFLDSQGISKKLLTKVGILGKSRTKTA